MPVRKYNKYNRTQIVKAVKDGRISGFIDLGDAGIGDPWRDYAWCIWSLEYNLKTNKYTPLLLKKLGITFDEEKFIKYTM